MIMWEKKIPAGVTIPDDDHDWSSKMVEEAMVGHWALAKLKKKGQKTRNSTSYPLLNRLNHKGVEEILVMVKCVDFRSSAVLAEYTDPDTAQVQSIWLHVSHLYEPATPLSCSHVGQEETVLVKKFLDVAQRVESEYAKQTLLQFFNE